MKALGELTKVSKLPQVLIQIASSGESGDQMIDTY